MVDWRWTYTYDANGNQLTAKYDDDADGMVDWRWTYTYDASGNRLTAELDDIVDRRVAYTYACWE
jgi:YD repeat-containing protein